jgi:hypothetical protein
LVLALAVLAFRNGVNVSDRGDIPDDVFFVQLYYAIGLFALGGMDLGMPTGGPRAWQNVLVFTYFAAPALAAAAVLEGLSRAIWLRLVDRWPWRDHIVVAGAGRVARAVVAECRRTFPGASILVVEKDITDAQAKHFRHIKKVHLVGGDMTDPRAVEGLRIGKARSLLLLTNDELANVELAVQVRHTFAADGGLPMLVRVADLDLMDRANRMLGRGGWAPCVNIHKAVAEKICRDSIEYMRESEGRETLVFTGFGRFCQTYLRQFMDVRGSEQIASIAIIAKEAELAWERFFDALPADQQARLGAIDVRLQSGLQEDPRAWQSLLDDRGDSQGGGRGKLVVLLGTNDDQSNLKAAMRVRDRSPDAYVMVRTFAASSFALHIGTDMNLQIVDIARELDGEIKKWVAKIAELGSPA